MRKITITKKVFLAVMFLVNIISYSQNFKPFTPRYDQDIRGDVMLIGNNILNRNTSTKDPNDPYSGNDLPGVEYNSDFDMEYIDTDGDNTTFSSSSANLASPRPGGDNCYKIVYVGLYWGAIIRSDETSINLNDINKIKFKLPTGGYNDITGQVVYNASSTTDFNGSTNRPYACYADVTSLFTSLANPVGTYTVANVLSSQLRNGGTGLSAGWSLFIVYEDPTVTSKSIVSFDGFSNVNASNNLDVPVTGFRTIPAGPVAAKFAFTCLEGDDGITGDYLRINGTTLSTPQRPANNFFNSTITTPAGFFTTRTPNSSNTLGFDAGIISNFNPLNSVIANNATSATLSLGSTQDAYFYYFTAFAVDIIAPDILLTKDVEDVLGNPIGGTPVNLGQPLDYTIGFQNVGNDPATSFTIKDVLPVNVIFNYPADIDLSQAPPGTTSTYNAPTRTLIFTIPNDTGAVDHNQYYIGIHVQVVSTCLEMDDACSNLIQNQAFATYSGTNNTAIFSDEGSIASFGACGFGTPGSTNFLVGLDNCNFTRTEVLCGNDLVLTAANGYQSYVWSGPGVITPVPGTNNQSVTVHVPGTYTVNDNINTSPCKSIIETINVISFDFNVTNPVLPFADQVVICPDDLKELPLIFLCGASDSQLITTNIANAVSISWEKLNSCTTTVTNANCANESSTCSWTPVGTGSNYNATTAGEYRIVITFQGGCKRIFYFNVFQNLLAPTVVTRDIVCTTLGQITVNNVPPGYLYSLTPAGSPPGTWVPTNIFTIPTAGVYTIHIQQIGVVGGCIFTVPNIAIQARTLTVTTSITQPLCFGQKGSITLTANNVNPQYTFIITQGGSPVNSVGPIAANNYTFPNLSPGNYSYQVTTQDGCNVTGNFTINNPPLLTVTAAITKPLTCTDGEITIYPVGGVPPYSYFINSGSVFQSTPTYPVTAAGTYNIQVVDSNNCSATTSIVVTAMAPPVFTVNQTNILCYGSTTGAINFNVTNPNGYTLGYSITGAAPFTTNPNFTNLAAGTYTAVVQYTIAGQSCTTPPQTITITEPTTALTASGGVAAVACASNGGNGIVRITNVQGGTPFPGPNPYQYNFGAGYQNSNQANLPPGTYTIYVRDANLCVFAMTITLDPIPPDPTISVGTPVFNCNGSATSTVTVNNGTSSYSYTYSINPPLVPAHNPASNVFTNVPCGNSVVTVNYTLVSPPTYSNLLFENFGSGNDTTSPGINPGYCFERQINNAATWCKTGPVIEDGDYSVTKKILFPYGAWYPFLDHTTNGVDPNARFLAINIGGVAGIGGIIYSKPIVDIIPNQDIRVSLWAANLLKIDPFNNQPPPDLTIQLIKDLGLPTQTIIAATNTGNIPKSNAWINYNLNLNPGANTNLSFVIRSNIAVTSGNDVVIDDINVFQLPVACLSTRNFPINIPCNQAFTAQVTGHHDVSCAGLNDATITIAAQNFNAVNGFQASMNNGATWNTYFTSPVTIPVPVGYPGFVLVRFDATPTNSACSLNLPQTIITPTALSASATATTVTCLANATITVTATGGTPAYQYQLTNSGGTVIVAYQASPIFNNIAPGNYIVVVRDVNLCTSSTTAITIVGPTRPTLTLSAASDFCYDTTNGATLVVTASGGVAPYQYSINGGPNQASNIFANLIPGTYTIVVTDAYGCTNAAAFTQTINPQLTLTTGLTKDLDCTASPNAVITGTITGGYPGYTYQVSINAAPYVNLGAVTGSTFTYSATTAGTYQFQVTDTRGCIAQSSVITINPLVLPTATTAVTNVTCNGLSNGSVTITPSLGVPPYSISFAGSPFTAATTYSGLAAGTYTYQVRDSKSCIFNGSVTITQPLPITGSASITTPYTCTTSGVITVALPSGGTPGYTYSINGFTFQASNIFTITSAGSYVITIKDANNCTIALAPIVVTALTPPTDIAFATSAMTCPTNTTNVTLTVTGGSLPLTYQMGAGPVQASNVFNNVAPGTYTFTVTDSRNCTYQESFTVNPIPALTVVGTLVANVQCFGTSTGAIRFTVGGFSPSYSYVITGPPNSSASGQTAPVLNVTNLPAGTYTIVVTNPTTNCTATTSVTVTQPAAALAAPVTTNAVTCVANGQAIVNATGGWGGYTYTIAPVVAGVTQSGNTFSNIPAGSYNITTTDSSGCSVITPFTLVAPILPTASVNVVASDFCYDGTNGASIVVAAAGGVGPYTFNINGGPFQASNTLPSSYTFGPLTPGNYTIIVKDSFGCMVTLPVQTINPQLTLTTGLTKDLDCTASPNAVITGTVAGGYPGYTYQVSINTAPYVNLGPVTGSTFTYSAATAGTYQFQVTDTKGCIVQATTITINPLTLPQIASVTQIQQILCNGDSNAAINVVLNPAVGTGPFIINVFNNTTGINYGTQTSGLAAGNYTITVTDSKSCTDTEVITINQPAPIVYTEVVVPITCTGTGTTFGSISVTNLTGGTAQYTYILTSNVSATQTFGPTPGIDHTFTVLNYGLYELTVVDANGCSLKKNIIMSSPPTDLSIDLSTPTASCGAGGTIIVTVSVLPAGGPYHFSNVTPYVPYPGVGGNWQNSDVPGGLTSTFTGLIPGVTYSFVVYDELTQCYFFKEASGPVPALSNITSTINVVNNVTCMGSADATVSFTYDTQDATSVTYQIFNSQSNVAVGAPVTTISAAGAPTTISNVGPLSPGTYYILFTENNGSFATCNNASATFTVTESVVALSINALGIKNDNCNVNAGQISATAQGGTAPYLYIIQSSVFATPLASDPSWNASNVLNAEAGNYFAYVKDAFGCIQQSSVIVLGSDPSPVVAASIFNACAAEGSFAINVSLTTVGVGPHTYSIDGNAFQTMVAPFTVSGLSSGPHTVIVRDFNGCGNTVGLTILTPVTVSAAFTTQPTCLNNNGTITVTATGGSGNYTYTLLTPALVVLVGPQPSNVFAGQAAGNYIIRVTDTTTGCNTEIPFSLIAPTAVTFTTTTQPVSCLGNSNGIITVNLGAGNNNPPYTYAITAGPMTFVGQPSNIFTGLLAGTYTVVVTSGRGCSFTDTNVIVGSPTAVVASGSALPFTCAANNTTNTTTLTIIGSGGTPAYTYSIDGVNYFASGAFTIVDSGSVQNITITVKDANGCIGTNNVIINPIVPLASTFTTNQVINCTQSEIVTINASGGTGSYTYQVIPVGTANVTQGVSPNDNQFTITAPGSYTFQVTDANTGCYLQTAPYVINPFNTINVLATPNTPVTCFGGSNGSINVVVSGYSGAYTYTVLDSSGIGVPTFINIPGNTATPLTISGLMAGSYTVQVTESALPLCIKVSNTVTVGTPSAAVGLTLNSNINANCNRGAIVTVTGFGGTPGYTYAFMPDGVAPTAANYSPINSATLALPQLLWDVHVLDSNGCHAMIDVTIAMDPLPTITVPVFAADQCMSSGTSYTFTATGTGVAPLTFSIGSGFQSSGTFTVSAPGTYNVIVKDVNGCTATDDIVIYPPLGFTPTVTTVTSCANNDGVITVTASGGSGNYSYTLLTGAAVVITGPQPSNVFGGLSSGNYIIRVTDTTTNCSKDLPVTLDAATPVTFNTVTTGVTCFGGNDGSITVNLLPGNNNPTYTYQIIAPIAVGPQSSNVFSGLPFGTYTIQVNSGRACSATQPATITQPAIIVVPAATVSQFACTAGSNATNFATITVNGVTGGSGTYTNYEFIFGGATVQSGASNVYTATNLTGGTYTINVYDNKGCVGSTTAVVNPFVGILNPVVTVTTPVTCISTESIAVTVTTTGISPVLTYTINSIPGGTIAGFPQTNNTGIFNGLVIGDYLITVTNPVTNCSVETIHYVFNPNTFTLNVTPVSNVICVGGTDGSVSLTIVDNDLTPTNDAGPFSYIIQNINTGLTINGNSATAGPTPPITGLTAGVYTVTVTLTNIPTCPVTSGFTIDEPSAALALAITNTPITCNIVNNVQYSDGSITALGTGGWGAPYQYQLAGPINVAYSTNNVFNNLTAGNYTVSVRDVRGCVIPGNITLAIPAPINAAVAVGATPIACFGDTTGTITVAYPTGGQGSNYSYTLNTGNPIVTASGPITIPAGGVVITGLPAGTYSVTINDGYSCTFTSTPVVITQPSVVNASLAVTTTPTCTGNTVLTLTAQGGTAPYTYSADNVTYSVATFNPSTTINLPAGTTGTYHYFIKDANGCVSLVSNDVQIDPLTPLNIHIITETDILCGGTPSGSITVNATGGLLNYVYTLLNGAGTPIPGATQPTPGYFTNLAAGNYLISVTSVDCTYTTPTAISITEPTPLTVTPTPRSVKCNGGRDGAINLVIAGGSGAIQYAISPNLDQFSTIANPYIATGFDIPNLTAGTYTIIIQDQNGCFEQFNNLVVGQPTAITSNTATFTNVTCTEFQDGTITLTGITGGTGPYLITPHYTTSTDNTVNPPVTIDTSVYSALNNTAGASSHVFTNLAGGNYLVGIKDNNGCIYLVSVDIDPGLLYTPKAVVDIHCKDVGGVSQQYVEVTAINTDNLPSGTFPANGGFLFSLDNPSVSAAQTSPVFNSDINIGLLTPGNHIIYVFTNNGCDDETPPFTILASDIDPLVLTLEEGGLNEIIANTNNALGQPSGTPPYTFTFNGYNNGSDNSFIYEYSGVYDVTVTDSKGCIARASAPFVFVPIFIPNVFTPNGNGGNDVWGPTNTSNYKNLVTKVYDRYGRMIAELPEGSFWDGKYKGAELPSGDYWYVVKVDGNNDKEYVGHFTLYR